MLLYLEAKTPPWPSTYPQTGVSPPLMIKKATSAIRTGVTWPYFRLILCLVQDGAKQTARRHTAIHSTIAKPRSFALRSPRSMIYAAF